jgi:hypothetical protein
MTAPTAFIAIRPTQRIQDDHCPLLTDPLDCATASA